MSRLGEEGDSLQVDALVYFLGDDTEDILSASILAGAKKLKFEVVLALFKSYLVGKRNVIYESSQRK